MSPRFPMDRRTLLACMLVAGALAPVASDALAQGCIPVVLAFRHAEDTNPPSGNPIFTLTPTGKTHAQLYPGMVDAFRNDKGYCPVAKVYSTTTDPKPSGCIKDCASATNAFFTGQPLAQAAMSGADPITSVGNNRLYEYLGNGDTGTDAPTNPNYSTAVAVALRAELVATANAGKSSAIFWTSQGLHTLGGVIVNGNSNVPVKNGGSLPPRNAVYVFQAAGPVGNVTGFLDSPKQDGHPVPSSVYVQCYNHVEASDQFGKDPQFIAPSGDPPVQLYYCGYNFQSDLGLKPPKCEKDVACGTIPNDRNKDVKGKICNTITSMEPDTGGTFMFGACR